MIDLWLEAIESLILGAPGGTDAGEREWVSTVERLGVEDVAAGREKVFWDRDDAIDVGLNRPCFVLQEVVADWSEYNLNDLALVGIVEVYYTELALVTEGEAESHKRSKAHFCAWTGALIQSCAERAKPTTALSVPICRIRQSLLPTRSPREDRDPDHPERDYWEAAWEFWIGEKARWGIN